jgi:hypothetical protein
MAGDRLLERLTASDLFLLLWDDYGWSTDIGGLAILDGTSLLDDEGRVRVDGSGDTSSRGCTWCLASGSCCTGPASAWAGPCGSTLLRSISPTTSESTRLPRQVTTASYCRHASSWPGGRSIPPARCGSCGCCPACQIDGSARS